MIHETLHVVKMENGEYLCVDQEDSFSLFGTTTKELKYATTFNYEDLQETIEALVNHKKLSGVSYGKVTKDVFTLHMLEKLKPVSYLKVKKEATIEEEVTI